MNIIDLATKTMQTAIKSVVDTIKTVVDAIKTTTDSTKTTVDTIDTRTNTTNTNVNTINTNVGSPTSTASKTTSANAHAKLNYLTAYMPTGIVKSVQHGTIASSSVGQEITISTVNRSKSFLVFSSSNANTAVQLNTSNTLKVMSNPSEVYWQVIEFY